MPLIEGHDNPDSSHEIMKNFKMIIKKITNCLRFLIKALRFDFK